MREWLIGWLEVQTWYLDEFYHDPQHVRERTLTVLLDMGVLSFNKEGYYRAYRKAHQHSTPRRIKMEVLPGMSASVVIDPDEAIAFAEYILLHKSENMRDVLAKWQNDKWRREEEERDYM